MPVIYLDMDGVLADFNSSARRHLRATAQDQAAAAQAGRWPKQEWKQLIAVPNFYRHLPPMPRADELVALAYRFKHELGWDLRILTAIPANNEVPDVFQDKFDWMAEHYPGIRLCFGPYSVDKWRHAQAGDVLVDDRTTNCEEWRTAGGRAVQVTSDYAATLDQLTQILEHELGV